jgi:hypothetical protein
VSEPRYECLSCGWEGDGGERHFQPKTCKFLCPRCEQRNRESEPKLIVANPQYDAALARFHAEAGGTLRAQPAALARLALDLDLRLKHVEAAIRDAEIAAARRKA